MKILEIILRPFDTKAFLPIDTGDEQHTAAGRCARVPNPTRQAQPSQKLRSAFLLLLHDISTEVFGRAYLEVRAGYFTH
jgi:hypothetical protein